MKETSYRENSVVGKESDHEWTEFPVLLVSLPEDCREVLVQLVHFISYYNSVRL